MRLPVPFVESRIVDSVLIAKLLYRDVLREALSLGQTLELRSLATSGTQEPKALNFWSSERHYARIFG